MNRRALLFGASAAVLAPAVKVVPGPASAAAPAFVLQSKRYDVGLYVDEVLKHYWDKFALAPDQIIIGDAGLRALEGFAADPITTTAPGARPWRNP
jgi:hypothetical protein